MEEGKIVDAEFEPEDIEVKRSTRLLKVEFSVKERLEMTDQIGNAYRNKDQAEGELKTVKAQYDGKIKQFEAEIKNLMEKVNTRWEMRSVECEETRNYRTGNVHVARIDTGEIIEERAMTSSERQLKLPIGQQEPPEASQDKPETTIADGDGGGDGGTGAQNSSELSGNYYETPEIINETPTDELPEDTNSFYAKDGLKTQERDKLLAEGMKEYFQGEEKPVKPTPKRGRKGPVERSMELP